MTDSSADQSCVFCSNVLTLARCVDQSSGLLGARQLGRIFHIIWQYHIGYRLVDGFRLYVYA